MSIWQQSAERAIVLVFFVWCHCQHDNKSTDNERNKPLSNWAFGLYLLLEYYITLRINVPRCCERLAAIEMFWTISAWSKWCITDFVGSTNLMSLLKNYAHIGPCTSYQYCIIVWLNWTFATSNYNSLKLSIFIQTKNCTHAEIVQKMI